MYEKTNSRTPSRASSPVLEEALTRIKSNSQLIAARRESPSAANDIAEDSHNPSQSEASKTLPVDAYQKFLQKGREVAENLAKASGPDTDRDYATKSKSYLFWGEEPIPTLMFPSDGGKVGDNLRVPFEAMGFEDNEEWMNWSVNGGDWNLEKDTHVAYHSKEQKVLVVNDTDHKDLRLGFPREDLIFHSEHLFHGWKKSSGDQVANLQYAVIAQIQNHDSRLLIKKVRATIHENPIPSQKITFTAASSNDAESEGFFALAGTVNGKLIFRMLTDHHNEMNGKTIVAVHTWGYIGPNDDPVLIWELK